MIAQRNGIVKSGDGASDKQMLNANGRDMSKKGKGGMSKRENGEKLRPTYPNQIICIGLGNSKNYCIM